MTALSTLLDTVLDETGFSKPSSYFGNTAEAAVRARTLANASVRDITKLPVRGLVKEGTISITTATLYDLPADLDGWVHTTMYEGTDTDPARFPTSDQEFSYLKTTGLNRGVDDQVRIIGDQIEILDPQNGETLSFTYRSNHPITDGGGTTTKKRYTADTDLWILDDDLHVLDIIWRWRKLHGMDYQDDLAIYKRYEKSFLGRDGGGRTLNFTGPQAASYPPPQFNDWV